MSEGKVAYSGRTYMKWTRCRITATFTARCYRCYTERGSHSKSSMSAVRLWRSGMFFTQVEILRK